MLFFAQNSGEVLRLPSHRKGSSAVVETEGPSVPHAKETNYSVFEFDQGNIFKRVQMSHCSKNLSHEINIFH